MWIGRINFGDLTNFIGGPSIHVKFFFLVNHKAMSNSLNNQVLFIKILAKNTFRMIFLNGHQDIFFETFETSAISTTSSLNFEMDTFDMPNCSSVMISRVSAHCTCEKFPASFIKKFIDHVTRL